MDVVTSRNELVTERRHFSDCFASWICYKFFLEWVEESSFRLPSGGSKVGSQSWRSMPLRIREGVYSSSGGIFSCRVYFHWSNDPSPIQRGNKVGWEEGEVWCVSHTCNCSTREADAGGSHVLRTGRQFMQHGKFQASLSYIVNPTPKEKKKRWEITAEQQNSIHLRTLGYGKF